MDLLLSGLRAAGEPTRLRLLALCAHGELSVTELTRILGQSQPRVSRHLKLLVEAGLLERHREGSLVYYRLAGRGASAELARTLVDLLPGEDAELGRDLGRLEQTRERRLEAAEDYFRENAADWDQIRALHVPEAEVEARLREIVGSDTVDAFLDIGTGTGRILQLFAPQAGEGIGLDNSAEMLAVARTRLARDGHHHVRLRKGDMYAMPLEDASIDLATLHLVLHYSLEPERVLAEAARTLRPGGRLVVVDFAEHAEERLRTEHAHQRLGFAEGELREAIANVGLEPGPCVSLAGDPLTVNIWQGTRPAVHRPAAHRPAAH